MKTKIKNFFSKISYKDIIIFLIPIIAFVAVLYIYYPGILSNDSYTQLNQIKTSFIKEKQNLNIIAIFYFQILKKNQKI